MRIAQVVSMEESVPPKFQNGLEFIVSWLSEELVRRGHKVTLFAPGDSKTKAKLKSILPKSLASEMNSWAQPFPSLWNSVFASSQAENFDVIHTHTRSINLTVPFIKVPVIETIHHSYSDSFRKKYFAKKNYLQSMKFFIDQNSKIYYVTISKKQEEDFKKCQEYYFKKHKTIYNGIPVERFKFNNKPEDYLFFIGYINKNKGADIAVKVARKLKMKLILAGRYKGEEKFFKEKIKPYLSRKIRYVGPVGFKEKNRLYKNALATLTPINWQEPFGLTLVESQACGTPVIAFNKGAAVELIKNGKTGFVVKDQKGMIEAVKKIKQIDRKECRKWVEKRFSVSRMVDDYEKLYKSLLR